MVDPERLERYGYDSRFEKAHKIEGILKDYLRPVRDGDALDCLDVGCSIGVISSILTGTFKRVVGVEPLEESIGLAPRIHPDSKATFVQGDGLRLPFRDEAFDVIICAQVYEHSADPAQLVAEIRRTLRSGGCCFFSGPNRLWPLEYHYGWLGLHWLPRSVLDRYCQRRSGHAYDLRLYHYWQLRSLWQDFEWIDYTLRLVYEPGRFMEATGVQRWARLVPRPVAGILRWLAPNFNWVLVKTAEPSGV